MKKNKNWRNPRRYFLFIAPQATRFCDNTFFFVYGAPFPTRNAHTQPFVTHLVNITFLSCAFACFIHIHIHTHTPIYIYIYERLCVCVLSSRYVYNIDREREADIFNLGLLRPWRQVLPERGWQAISGMKQATFFSFHLLYTGQRGNYYAAS